ncbi:hypothetical protein [Halomarina oriensis]|uniref:Uncharacterized protein n=1 Tax=Halomarina oriensis TaxID=671145 RepID=A0A6B0GMW7_9EURY|nr:hypothetical protein [Halomarina oriensis]MWG36212.1 hypothetical protein [Halomarina oriensis]
MKRRQVLALGVGALAGTSGCLGFSLSNDNGPHIPGGSIEFTNRTDEDATLHVTVHHVTDSERELNDISLNRPDPSTLEALSPPRDLYIAAPANGNTIAESFIDEEGGYYLNYRLGSETSALSTYWFTERYFPWATLRDDGGLQTGAAGNFD